MMTLGQNRVCWKCASCLCASTEKIIDRKTTPTSLRSELKYRQPETYWNRAGLHRDDSRWLSGSIRVHIVK